MKGTDDDISLLFFLFGVCVFARGRIVCFVRKGFWERTGDIGMKCAFDDVHIWTWFGFGCLTLEERK